MKLDNVRRIIVEDFPKEDQTTIGKLADVLNSFMEQTVNVINGNISQENLARPIVKFKVRVNGTGIPLQTTKFSARIGIIGSVIVNVKNESSNSVFVNLSPFMSFEPLGNGIYTVKQVTGLNPNDEYIITVELL